jgi:hypothetical protein
MLRRDWEVFFFGTAMGKILKDPVSTGAWGKRR